MAKLAKSTGYPLWLLVLVPLLLLVHQASWYWSDTRLVFGLPVNLLYHSVLSLLVSAIMLVVVWVAWPRDLDQD